MMAKAFESGVSYKGSSKPKNTKKGEKRSHYPLEIWNLKVKGEVRGCHTKLQGMEERINRHSVPIQFTVTTTSVPWGH